MVEDPAVRTYRRVLVVFVLVGALIAVGVGLWLLLSGRLFEAFLGLCAAGLFVLLAYGYRQDERERGGR
jgi:hypothetical protein